MRKKLLLMLLTCMCICSGCTTTESVNVAIESSNELNNTKLGKSALIKIGDFLWYDSTTRIIYWWNGNLTEWRSDTTPTPYYAPNGLPYRYNPETNTFEEIKARIL